MTRAAASSLNQYENNKLDLQVKNIPSGINADIESANDQVIRPPLSGMRDMIIVAFRDYDGILRKGAVRWIGRQERHSRDRRGGSWYRNVGRIGIRYQRGDVGRGGAMAGRSEAGGIPESCDRLSTALCDIGAHGGTGHRGPQSGSRCGCT